jgi:membrane fusion protein (multidrug efflux system)
VTSGLQAGDEIVVDGTGKLRVGSKITAAGAAATPAVEGA